MVTASRGARPPLATPGSFEEFGPDRPRNDVAGNKQCAAVQGANATAGTVPGKNGEPEEPLKEPNPYESLCFRRPFRNLFFEKGRSDRKLSGFRCLAFQIIQGLFAFHGEVIPVRVELVPNALIRFRGVAESADTTLLMIRVK